MTRSMRGRSRLYRPTAPPRVYRRGTIVAFPQLPMEGFWTEFASVDWTPLSSPTFDMLIWTGSVIVGTDSLYGIVYDPDTNTWDTSAPDVNSVGPFAAYLGGSWTGELAVLPDGSVAFPAPWEFVFPDFIGHTLRFDPVVPEWDPVELAPPPDGGRYLYGSTQIDDDFYVVAGLDPNLSVDDGSYNLYRYNTATDTWTTLADAPIGGFCPGAWNQDGSILAIVGDDNNDIDGEDHVLEYDIATDTWTDRLDLQAAILEANDEGFSVDNAVYVGTNRVLLLDNGGSPPTDARIWNVSSTMPVQTALPIDPSPIAFEDFHITNGACTYIDNSIFAFGTRLDGPPKIVPFQKYTLGDA